MILDCSHHYCRRCGKHGSYTVELSHEPDCPLLESELREEAFWREARRKRSQSSVHESKEGDRG